MTIVQRILVDVPSRWIVILESLYFCFVVRPWSRNVAKSLIKEPKIYLYDWSTLGDEGFRSENLVAVHLLKAVQLWTDLGFAIAPALPSTASGDLHRPFAGNSPQQSFKRLRFTLPEIYPGQLAQKKRKFRNTETSG